MKHSFIMFACREVLPWRLGSFCCFSSGFIKFNCSTSSWNVAMVLNQGFCVPWLLLSTCEASTGKTKHGSPECVCFCSAVAHQREEWPQENHASTLYYLQFINHKGLNSDSTKQYSIWNRFAAMSILIHIPPIKPRCKFVSISNTSSETQSTVHGRSLVEYFTGLNL